MAAKRSVWGIDIGQSALKALKCRVSDDGETVVAESYDYVEYPKLLSSPEANPAELISDALEQFLSRNETLGDEVAISVPGNTGRPSTAITPAMRSEWSAAKASASVPPML